MTLGQLFTINFAQYHKSKEVKAKNLILAGMGEPGCFAQDSLRLVMSNIVVAVKSMGEDQFATTLLGTRRKEMSIADALRGFLQGLLDGYERLEHIRSVDIERTIGQGAPPRTVDRYVVTGHKRT